MYKLGIGHFTRTTCRITRGGTSMGEHSKTSNEVRKHEQNPVFDTCTSSPLSLDEDPLSLATFLVVAFLWCTL